MTSTLIFIYNASGGKLSAAMDIAHKVISPGTYKCDLCQLTHGVFKERAAWTAFKQRSSVKMEFYHKDEWSELGGDAYTFPVILKRSGDACTVYMSADEIALQSDIEMLISSIEERLEKEH